MTTDHETETAITQQTRQEAELAAGTESGTQFTPALWLAHATMPIVLEQNAKAGDLVFNDVSLGNKVPIFILAKRFHAVHTEDGDKKLETFNALSPILQEIKSQPNEYPDSVPRWGYSWLVYIPQINQIAILHPSSNSARGVNKNIVLGYEAKGNTRTAFFELASKMVQNKKKTFTWPIPVATPLPKPDHFEDLTGQRVEAAIKLFMAPVHNEDNEEVVEETIER